MIKSLTDIGLEWNLKEDIEKLILALNYQHFYTTVKDWPHNSKIKCVVLSLKLHKFYTYNEFTKYFTSQLWIFYKSLYLYL